jgi:hypothetical protein
MLLGTQLVLDNEQPVSFQLAPIKGYVHNGNLWTKFCNGSLRTGLLRLCQQHYCWHANTSGLCCLITHADATCKRLDLTDLYWWQASKVVDHSSKRRMPSNTIVQRTSGSRKPSWDYRKTAGSARIMRPETSNACNSTKRLECLRSSVGQSLSSRFSLPTPLKHPSFICLSV